MDKQPEKNKFAKTEQFHITELDCPNEVPQIRKSLKDFPGIESLSFNVLESLVEIEYLSDVTNTDSIQNKLTATGWTATVYESSLIAVPQPFWKKHGRIILTGLSALFLILGFISNIVLSESPFSLNMFQTSSHLETSLPLTAIIFYILSIFAGGAPVVIRSFKSVQQFRADMNVLMTVAVIGAVLLNEWLEAAMVTFLFSLSLTLEGWSTSQAKKAIANLVSHIPDHVLWKNETEKNSEWIEKPVKQIQTEDLILIQPGDKFPLDGIVLSGVSLVDQSPITGESVPVEKKKDDEVFAGTLNTTGSLEIQVTKITDDSMLAQIQKMVLKAQSGQAPVEQFVERFARIYTPIMLLISLLIMTVPPLFFAGVWSEWFYRSLVILVIACPCALVISTPVSIVSALSSAARKGILIKGGRYLEKAAYIKAIAFDKTGTITYGQPIIEKIIPLNQYSEYELLEIAASIESHSPHPFSEAVVNYARDKQVSFKESEDYHYQAGQGGIGNINGKQFWVGGLKMLKKHFPNDENQFVQIRDWEAEGFSTILIGNHDHLIGSILFRDSLRPHAVTMLQNIRKLGIERTFLLTGDNRLTARRIAMEADIDTVHAELMPVDKQELIQQIKKEVGPVMMIGDGINDAPAMAMSSLSLSMGQGTDIAIETSDITLMNENLNNITELIQISRRTIKIIQQNITFALGLKIIFLLLTLMGFASMWLAILADTGASLIVVANGLRLLNNGDTRV